MAVSTFKEALPLIEFDRTLYDYFSLDGGNPDEVALLMASIPPKQPVVVSQPANKKYTWQSPACPNLDKGLLARIFLANAALNHHVGLGPMRLYLFDIDPPEHNIIHGLVESPPSHRTDAAKIIEGIIISQRPKIEYISDATTFQAPPGVLISAYPPQDFLDKHPTIMSQESNYKLQSKRELVFSGLPTPYTDVIDTVLEPADIADSAKVEAEAQRILEIIRSHKFPFVIKFPLAVGGFGVFVVRNELQLAAAEKLGRLAEEIPQMLRSIKPENAHLHPAGLCLQDVVDGGTTRNLSIFVTKKGRAEFLSCCEQFLDEEDGIWRGSIIDYARQDELERQYRPLLDQIATYVHGYGFYGPMGGDIMTDGAGNQFVVDLNTRITGDVIMGPLRGHYYERRGMRYSYIIPSLVILGNRERFEDMFWPELANGILIIVGWVHGRGGFFKTHEYSVGSLMIGGKDRESLMELVDRVSAIGFSRPPKPHI